MVLVAQEAEPAGGVRRPLSTLGSLEHLSHWTARYTDVLTCAQSAQGRRCAGSVAWPRLQARQQRSQLPVHRDTGALGLLHVCLRGCVEIKGRADREWENSSSLVMPGSGEQLVFY